MSATETQNDQKTAERGSEEDHDKPGKFEEEDARKFIICGVHEGSHATIDFQAKQYVRKKRAYDGVAIIDIKKTWDKLYLAARIIACVENWADVCVVSGKPIAQRALLKFAAHTRSSPVVGRFTPGSLTNQVQKKNFKEPRLLIVSDPKIDHQAVREASYVNIPVIALCNANSPMQNIDIAIPCNNEGPHSVGLIYWMLAREVLHLRGMINKKEAGFVIDAQEIVPDLYFHREPLEIAPDEEEAVVEEGPQPTPEFLMPEHVYYEPAAAIAMEVEMPTMVVVEPTRFEVVTAPVPTAVPEEEKPIEEEPRLDLKVERIKDWAAASKPHDDSGK